jgi:hypothetical protein
MMKNGSEMKGHVITSYRKVPAESLLRQFVEITD